MSSPPVAAAAATAAAKGTKPGFQFITSINTIARNDETRRRVRSHARRQKLPSQTNAPHQPKRQATQKDRISKFRVGAGGGAGGTCASAAGGRRKRVPASSSTSAENKPSAASGCVTEHGGRQWEEGKLQPKWETTMIARDLFVTVARELPNFSLLRIETTPLTENLLKYCMTVCLSPQEKFVQKWIDRAGAPTYMYTQHSSLLATTFAMNPSGDWMGAINVDAAATHAFMANVAAMHNSLANWDDTTTIDFHRFQAVKSVNERLNMEGKDMDTPVSDGVIVAVALLVNTEAYIGSLAAAAAHMNGLKRMVELRGGLLDGFGYSSLLQRTMAWADFSYATAANKPLVFPLIPQLAASLGLRDRFMSRSMVANTEATGLNDLSVQHREVLELFELLYSVADGINTFDWADVQGFKEERAQISDSIYFLEWRLCQLEDSIRRRQCPTTRAESLPVLMPSDGAGPGPCSGSSGSGAWSETTPPIDLSNAIVYASHIFLHLAIRGQPPAAHRHRALTEALMSSLCDTLMMLDLLSGPESIGSPESYHTAISGGQLSVESWGSSTSEPTSTGAWSSATTTTTTRCELHENILLWVLFVGCCVRMPAFHDDAPFMYRGILLGDHHEFFLNALAKYCRARNILDRDALLATLKDIVWLDRWCENQLELVWQEISDRLSY